MTNVLFRKIVAEPPEVIEPNTAYLILKGEGEDESFDLLVSSASGDRLVPIDMAAAGGGDGDGDGDGDGGGGGGGGGGGIPANVTLITLQEDFRVAADNFNTPATTIPGFEFNVVAGKRYLIEFELIIGWENPTVSHYLYLALLTLAGTFGTAMFGGGVLSYPEGSRITDDLIESNPPFQYVMSDFSVPRASTRYGKDIVKYRGYFTAQSSQLVIMRSSTNSREFKDHHAGSFLKITELP